jgi:hypothetical protein
MTIKISRLYDDHASAQNAVRDLKAAGLADGDISILASNADGWYKSEGVPNDPHRSAADPVHDKNRDGSDDRVQGAAVGGTLGAVAGGTAGALAGLGLLAIPGIGPVVAAGWLVATLAGAATAGAAGGVVGALAESGVDKKNAELYAETLRRGGALVTARVAEKDEAKYAAILDRSAVDITARQANYRSQGWTGFDQGGRPYDATDVLKEREQYRRAG